MTLPAAFDVALFGEAMLLLVADRPGPIEHATGFYLFRIESIGLPASAQVKEEILAEFRNRALREWVEATRKRVTVRIEDPAFFEHSRGTMK